MTSTTAAQLLISGAGVIGIWPEGPMKGWYHCPAFQRGHMSVLCIAESRTRLECVINTTFREKDL
jgi:hypothetical protein